MECIFKYIGANVDALETQQIIFNSVKEAQDFAFTNIKKYPDF